MKANELRIGNYFIDEVQNENTISAYYIHELEMFNNSPKYRTVSKYFKAIDLSEEWLIKLGFEQHTSNPFWFRKKQLCISVIGKVELISWDMHIFKIDTEIKYIHQLQNLYFSLTQEELIIE